MSVSSSDVMAAGVYSVRDGPPNVHSSTYEFVSTAYYPQDDRGDSGEYDAYSTQNVLQDQASFYERSQRAKRIRQQQLEDWRRRETKDPGTLLDGGLAQSGSMRRRPTKRKKKTVMFEWNVLLMDAVLRNELDEVDRMLVAYESLERCPRAELVNCRGSDGLSPLHQCCIENLEDMARLLIRNGANIRAVDLEQWTPLHAAATCGYLNICRLLIETGKMQQSAVQQQHDAGQDMVRDMLLAVNSDGNMPFDLCERGEPDTMPSLCSQYIESEMQLNGITQEDIDRRRHKQEADMLKDVLEYIEKNSKGFGSIHRRTASFRNNKHIWDDFIAACRVPNAVLMHIAASNGYLEVLDLLIKHKYPVDLEDEDGWLPIHAAVAWNQAEAARKLVEAGADITAKVRGTNESALDLAHVADGVIDASSQERFRDQLISWDDAYRTRREQEAKATKGLPRQSSSDSTTAPGASSPTPRRTPSNRVQRKSSLKDKEDLIALLHTLGAHDLNSSEDRQADLVTISRSPGGSLRDRNPVLPTVPEGAVMSSNVVQVEDVDIIDQTISPQLISSLLKSHDSSFDEDADSVADSLIRNAEESLNQIDHPVTLSQLKRNRNRFRLLKRKEKPLAPRDLYKDAEDNSKSPKSNEINEEKSGPLGNSSKGHEYVNTAGLVNRFVATAEEAPVGARIPTPKAQRKKHSFSQSKNKRHPDAAADPTSLPAKTNVRLPGSSQGCCVIS